MFRYFLKFVTFSFVLFFGVTCVFSDVYWAVTHLLWERERPTGRMKYAQSNQSLCETPICSLKAWCVGSVFVTETPFEQASTSGPLMCSAPCLSTGGPSKRLGPVMESLKCHNKRCHWGVALKSSNKHFSLLVCLSSSGTESTGWPFNQLTLTLCKAFDRWQARGTVDVVTFLLSKDSLYWFALLCKALLVLMVHASYVMNYKTMCFDVFWNTQYKIGFSPSVRNIAYFRFVMIYIYSKKKKT